MGNHRYHANVSIGKKTAQVRDDGAAAPRDVADRGMVGKTKFDVDKRCLAGATSSR